MRIFAVFVIILFLAQSSVAQKIQSSCEASDSVQSLYKKDAAHLCIDQYKRQSSPSHDSVMIPQQDFNCKMDALMAVYNVKGIPEADTVIRIKKNHDYQDELFYSMRIITDSLYPWMDSLRLKKLPTGNTSLDSLLTLYSITPGAYSTFHYTSTGKTDYKCQLNTPLVLNMDALYRAFAKIDIIMLTELKFGFGNFITDSVYQDHRELVYYYGWGDCLSGCMYYRAWKFNVYDDCSVEFVDVKGSELPWPFGFDPLSKSHAKVYPIPFTTSLQIEGLDNAESFKIYGMDGQLVKTGVVEQNQISDLTSLLPGMYLLHIQGDGVQSHLKVIKQ